MPATSIEALARKAAHKAKRHKQRLKSDPDYRETYNARKVAKAREAQDARRFVGCDGEGVRTKDGRAHYAVFRMGERELGPMAGDRRLLTAEILEFICQYPNADDILVGFAFDYDVSNILFDVPWDKPDGANLSRLERILRIDEEETPTRHHMTSTWLNLDGWPQYGVKYLPRNFLEVCRAETVFDRSLGKNITRAVKGSRRTIYDAFGFFQSSFLKALQLWKVGTLAQREAIEKMKAERSDFNSVTRKMRDYNALECQLLADMMEQFRDATLAAGLRPRTWNGAGKLAGVMHKEHATIKRQALEEMLHPDLRRMAHAAYYGGRFEVTATGFINQTVWDHDLKSAYPAAMLDMPCLVHGRWKRASGSALARLPNSALYVCEVKFSHPDNQHLCGLPFRTKAGGAGLRLVWPRQGIGTYWSCEIRSAKRLGARIEHRAGWRYIQTCKCKPLSWVEAVFAERVRLGKDKGIPIKLGINALYGKLAQRKGAATYQNAVWAGLITAMTRAKLNDAIKRVGQHNVVMIATDAIYTINKPAPVDRGDWLGQWGCEEYPHMFIVMPGLYWGPKRIKTRGVSPKYFEPEVKRFEATWFDYMDKVTDPTSRALARPLPVVPDVAVKTPIFIGLRLAYRQNKPDLRCQWVDDYEKSYSFDWSGKRGDGRPSDDGQCIITTTQAGNSEATSVCYTGKVKEHFEHEGATPAEMTRELFEAMPDHVDLSVPFK